MAKLKFKQDDTDKVLAGSSARMSADASADLKSKADAGMAQIKADKDKAQGPAPKKLSSNGSSFRAAFADARKSGDSTFMWNGKSFNTKLASDAPAKKAPAPAAKPSTPALMPAAKPSAPAAKPTTTPTRVTDDSKAKLGSFMGAMTKPDRWATPGITPTPAQLAKLEEADARRKQYNPNANAKGGKVKKLAKGGKIDGIAKRGLTRGRKK